MRRRTGRRPPPEFRVEERLSVPVWGQRDDRRWTRLRRPLTRVRSYYAFMLYQDIPQQMVPFRAQESGYRVVLEPHDGEELRSIIGRALSGDYYRTGLEEALRSFLEEAATALVLCGRTAYEIVYLLDRETGELVGFQLAQVPPGSYFRRFGRELQYVPRDLEQGRRGRVVQLDKDRLLVASFPPRRRWQLKRMFSALDVASEWFASTPTLQHGALFKHLPYDFSVHSRYLDVAVARATTAVGWDARGTFRERQLEPYRTWRQLQFEAFKIQVRDVLISALNEALQKVGKRMGWSATIRALGLPTMDDVQQAERDLRTGSCPVEDVIGRFLWHQAAASGPDDGETSPSPPVGGEARADDNQ
jgi:hypothetical protein